MEKSLVLIQREGRKGLIFLLDISHGVKLSVTECIISFELNSKPVKCYSYLADGETEAQEIKKM